MRAVTFHQLGLLGQRFRAGHVAHHQEARDVHAQVARRLDVLLADVRFGAVGRDAHRTHTQLISVLQIVDCADAGQKEGGQHRVFQHFGHGADPVPIGVGAKAVVEAGALQAVAVGDFDRVDLGPVKCAGNRLDVVQTILVTDSVHSVTQSDVLNVELLLGRVESHAAAPPCISLSCMRFAIFSAVLSAAEVMMSRLPA